MHNYTRSKPKKRDVDGILLLDKPFGITSNEALQITKRCYQANKAGHTGSLDPIATGMLPLCFGEATKFSQFLLDADKTYVVVGKLGIVTTSSDSEGEVIATRPWDMVTANKIEAILPQFRGKIMQTPSMYSAIKYKGEPLYKLARQGIEVERQPREVTLYELQLLSLQQDLVQLKVRCSKGTYVRTLIADIGEKLGCGAHVVELRRLTVGPFREEQMVKLATIQALADKNEEQQLDKLLLPIEAMLDGWNEVQLSADMVFYLRQGNPLVIPHAPTSGWVKFKTKSGELVGVGEVLADGKVAPRRLIKN